MTDGAMGEEKGKGHAGIKKGDRTPEPGSGYDPITPIPAPLQDDKAIAPTDPHRHHQGVIELRHMDMRVFCSFSLANSVFIRTLLYPSVLIKTRQQVQKTGVVYRNATDAFMQIIKSEGVRGLYRGFGVHLMNTLPSLCYIVTYENTRHALTGWAGDNTRSLLAGAAGSLVGQSLTVPVDVVSQHVMMLGRRDMQFHRVGREEFGRGASGWAVARSVYAQEGIRGVYRGYLCSLATFVSGSALWWFFYNMYYTHTRDLLPVNVPVLACQTMCGPLAGVTAAALTNPLDVVRTRMQVEGCPTAMTALRELVSTEGVITGFSKGVTARMLNSSFSSLILALLYETGKRLSLKAEYRDQFRW